MAMAPSPLGSRWYGYTGVTATSSWAGNNTRQRLREVHGSCRVVVYMFQTSGPKT